MSYLLDTCLISELVKRKANKTVINWIDQQTEVSLFLSVITIGEINKGIAKLPDSARKETLENWLKTDLTARFNKRIIPVDNKVALKWGEILGGGQAKGINLPVIDCPIAATAIVHDLKVVTRNSNDIERCGAAVFNPWTN